MAPIHNKTSVTPITEAAFAPYGGIISSGLQLPKTISNPAATKSLEVVTPTNHYKKAPSGSAARSVVHVEVVKPKVLALNKNAERVLQLERMERHPFTSQIFIPMIGAGGSDSGESGDDEDVRYLAIVADGMVDEDRPDIGTLKVFTVGAGVGICYGAGVWHASMSVVGKSEVTFVVLQYMNGVVDEDAEFVELGHERVEILV